MIKNDGLDNIGSNNDIKSKFNQNWFMRR
jgi:hypothetical protein